MNLQQMPRIHISVWCSAVETSWCDDHEWDWFPMATLLTINEAERTTHVDGI